MCHFCHVLRKNSQSPEHRSSKCLDKANTFSQVPMNKRIYENGKRIDQSSSQQTFCAVCWDQLANITFIPCGHVATCESCSSSFQNCPVCRQPINNKQKLYFV